MNSNKQKSKISANEFYNLLVRLSNNELFIKAAGMPRACELIAKDLWLKQAPESKDTVELRRQLLSLENTGCFDFKK